MSPLSTTLPVSGTRPRSRPKAGWPYVVAVLVVLCGALVAVRLITASTSLVWADNFNGPSGTSPIALGWTPQVGYFHGNNTLECMSASSQNSRLDGQGHLDLVARKVPPTPCGSAGDKTFTSARLMSRPANHMKYGRLVIRAKLAGGSGTWNALWLLGSNYPQVGWPKSGEIDLNESTSRQPGVAYATVHGPKNDGSHYQIGSAGYPVIHASTAYHVYELDWTPNAMTMDVDGAPFFRVTKAQVEKQGQWVFDHDFDIILSLAVGGRVPGSPPAAKASFPQTMSVDYVRLYSR